MTIEQAAEKGISRVRLPEWNERAYLRLHLIQGGYYGPWATLYDCFVDRTVGEPGLPREVPVWQLLREDFESYEGQKDEAEKETDG